MARVVVFQHGPEQPPARLGMTLRDHGFRLDIRRLDIPESEGGGRVPPDLDGVQGVVSLGGVQNVGDPLPWMSEQLSFLRAAHEAELPVIGVCLGHQLIAEALGGEVGKMDRAEAGFVDVRLGFPGQTDRIFAGVPWTSPQFQTHGYEVTKLPPGATPLASSDRCKFQAFCAGIRTYGMQFHFELDRAGIDTFVHAQPGIFERAGVTPDEVSAQCDKHYAEFARLANRLCVNLATLAFTFDELTKA